MRTKNNAKYVNNFNNYVESLAPKGQMKTYDTEAIVKILNTFSNTDKYQVNAHWSEYKHMMIEGASRGSLGLELSLGWPHLVDAKELEVHYFNNKPDFNFMRLKFSGLPETGINGDLQDFMYEEYARVNDEIYSRHIFDQGFLDHDENGEKIPLPPQAQLEQRFIKPGHMMIVSKGGVLNDTHMHKYMINLRELGENSPIYNQIKQI
jgi:hypothetical protein